MEAQQQTLPAPEAAEFLGVKLATLYAYASRGLVRSLAGGKGPARRYMRADLERLRARRDARSGHGAVAAGALRFGEPVMDSSITELDPERGPIYRGHCALELAESDTPFESVAELLWTGELSSPPEPPRPQGLGLSPAIVRELRSRPLAPLTLGAILVPLLASRDAGRFQSSADAVLPRARALIWRLALALGSSLEASRLEAAIGAKSVAATLARASGATGGEAGVRALRRTLVLAADHELNASAFAARVAASTGADVYACISAALATLSGFRHGGGTDRVEALVREAGDPSSAERVVHERMRRGEAVEGFGHMLYRGGDPRGPALLAYAHELAPDEPRVRTCAALAKTLAEARGVGPNLDLGLVAISGALGLAPGSAAAIFAVGRCAGWVAHILEQYEGGYLVRPRARYREA